MTLIIKELIIRGNVIRDTSEVSPSEFDTDGIRQYLDEIKKEIETECVDKVLSQLEKERKR